jgi:hypothetical protein
MHILWAKKMEPTTGLEPVNLFLTKEVLYLLSYVGLPNLLGRFPSSPNLYLPQYLPM